MKINTPFDISQTVYVIPLKIWGRVISIFFNDPKKIQYNVRYFDALTAKDCYFFEEELSGQETKESVGFKV